MSQADLVADLKASLHDAAAVFVTPLDADFIRHINIAASVLNEYRPRSVIASLNLVSNQADYAAPIDLIDLDDATMWHSEGLAKINLKMWDQQWPETAPRVSLSGDIGNQVITLSTPPTVKQLAVLGSVFRFTYVAAHSITVATTTVRPADRYLLLLRAQVEALSEIGMRNSSKPISHRGSGKTVAARDEMKLSNDLLQRFLTMVQQ